MTNLINNIFAVKVPEGAINFKIDMGYIIWRQPNYKNWVTNDILSDYGKLTKYLDTHNSENDYKTGGQPAPPGQWQIVCTSREATPEQAGQIVEYDGEGWKDYDKSNFHNDLPFMDSLNSFASLLTSRGLDLNKNYLILKKIA